MAWTTSEDLTTPGFLPLDTCIEHFQAYSVGRRHARDGSNCPAAKLAGLLDLLERGQEEEAGVGGADNDSDAVASRRPARPSVGTKLDQVLEALDDLERQCRLETSRGGGDGASHRVRAHSCGSAVGRCTPPGQATSTTTATRAIRDNRVAPDDDCDFTEDEDEGEDEEDDGGEKSGRESAGTASGGGDAALADALALRATSTCSVLSASSAVDGGVGSDGNGGSGAPGRSAASGAGTRVGAGAGTSAGALCVTSAEGLRGLDASAAAVAKAAAWAATVTEVIACVVLEVRGCSPLPSAHKQLEKLRLQKHAQCRACILLAANL